MEITDIKSLHLTDWLVLKQATCKNKDGKKFHWDYISRQNRHNVVSLICHSIDHQRILLLQEFRTPMNKWVIEFPKGLINAGETVEAAALRELKEETGYEGKIISASPFLATCAYLMDEMTAIVEIEVDESNPGDTQREKAEEIIPFWVHKRNFNKEMDKYQAKNFIIENNVWFCLNRTFQGYF